MKLCGNGSVGSIADLNDDFTTCGASYNGGDFHDKFGSVQISAPIDAGGPYNGIVGTDVPLSGAMPCGEDLVAPYYLWTATGPGTCAFSDPAAKRPSVRCDTPGTYTLYLDNRVLVGTSWISVYKDATTLTLRDVNHAPVADDDSYNATEDRLLKVMAPGVLGNDNDADGDEMSAVWVSDPSHGFVTLFADGSFNYLPVPDSCGNDWFSYKASDGVAESEEVRVSIDVACVNDAPTVDAGGPYSGEECSIPIDFTFSCTDLESPYHLAALVDWGDGSAPQDLSYVNCDSVDFAASHVYADDGEYHVELTVYDAAGMDGSGTASVSVANVPPDVDAGPNANVSEGDTFGQAGSFNDPGADPWTATVDYGEGEGLEPLYLSGMTFILDNRYEQAGVYDVEVCVYDDDTWGCDTVQVAVAPVNDAPTADGQEINVQADASQPIALTGQDLETPSENLTFGIATGPVHGTLAGPPPDLTYTPAAGYTGDDSFTFTVTDRGDPDGCSGSPPDCSSALTSAEATVTIHVAVGAPALAGISPASAQAGSEDVTIDLTGSNFVSVSQVRWNATTDLAMTYVGATHLTAVIPASLLPPRRPGRSPSTRQRLAVEPRLSWLSSSPKRTWM